MRSKPPLFLGNINFWESLPWAPNFEHILILFTAHRLGNPVVEYTRNCITTAALFFANDLKTSVNQCNLKQYNNCL